MTAFIECIESRTLLSAPPLLTTVQKQDLQKLGTDLSAIHAASDVTSAEITAVRNDFNEIAQVAHKPSAASVDKLESDTKAALADKTLTNAEKFELVEDAQAVVISAGIPTSLATQTKNDLKAIVVSSNVTKAEAKTIATDVKNILLTL